MAAIVAATVEEPKTHYTLADLEAGECIPDSLRAFMEREVYTDGSYEAERTHGGSIEEYVAEYLDGHDWPLEGVRVADPTFDLIHAAMTLPPFVVESLLGETVR